MAKELRQTEQDKTQRTIGGIPITRKLVLSIVVPVVVIAAWFIYILMAFDW